MRGFDEVNVYFDSCFSGEKRGQSETGEGWGGILIIPLKHQDSPLPKKPKHPRHIFYLHFPFLWSWRVLLPSSDPAFELIQLHINIYRYLYIWHFRDPRRRFKADKKPPQKLLVSQSLCLGPHKMTFHFLHPCSLLPCPLPVPPPIIPFFSDPPASQKELHLHFIFIFWVENWSYSFYLLDPSPPAGYQ